MYPQNNEPSDQQPAKDWFNSVNQPPAATSQPREPDHQRRIVVIGILIALILLVIGTVVLALIAPNISRTTAQCLTAKEYQAFNATAITDQQQSPKDSFYSTAINYAKDGASPITPTQDEIDTLMRKIGVFYEQYSVDASIVITLSGNYGAGGSIDTANSRLATLKQSLMQNGINEASIVTQKPIQLVDDGELSPDAPELQFDKAYLSITSAANCSE